MTHKGNTSIIIQMKVFDDQITLFPVFEEVRGGMMATIKREKFIANPHNLTIIFQY